MTIDRPHSFRGAQASRLLRSASRRPRRTLDVAGETPATAGGTPALPGKHRALAVFSFALIASVNVHADTSARDDWRDKMRQIIPLGYVCRHVDAPPMIDGGLDDAAWEGVPWTSEFIDIEGVAGPKPPPRFRTRAKLVWDDQYLYIAAELEEPHVWANHVAHDAVIFQDPDFEVFIDPDGDTHAYYEFEMNARNTTWDLLLEKPYQDDGPPRNDWEIPGMKSAVRVQGTINDPMDIDRGWTLEIAFPWKVLSTHARHSGPPHEGEQWRLNFSRVQWQILVEPPAYRKVPRTPEDNWVWSPQGVIDMHRPEMWGLLKFTRKPKDVPVTVDPIPAKYARDIVLDVYYAQQDFRKKNSRWATSLEELDWSADIARAGLELPVFERTDDGYLCRASFNENGQRITWTIRQDRLLTMEVASS